MRSPRKFHRPKELTTMIYLIMKLVRKLKRRAHT